MPICLFSLLLTAGAISFAAEKEIQLGDTKEQVIAILGKPKGVIKKGSYEYLSFHRGTVKIKDGKVVSRNLESEEDADKKEQERLAIIASREEASQQDAEAKKQKTAEGNSIKKNKIEDQEFAKLSPKERLEFWINFQKSYPNVSVNEEIAAVNKELPQEEPKEKTERQSLLETIEKKQEELDKIIAEAKTKSAGRTYRLRYLKHRKELEAELEDLRKKLRAMPAPIEKEKQADSKP